MTSTTTPMLPTPRLISGMPFAEYARIPALNWSTLKEMRRSPLHYAHRLVVEREDTTMFLRGRAAHTAIFEPDRFPLDYAVFDGERRQGKKWDEFKAANRGRSILRADEYAHCLALRGAVRKHPIARRYLERGRAEQVVTWTDRAHGLPCKARLDWLCDDVPVFIDLKTTNDIDMRRFGSVAARLGYHCQVAWYTRGLVAAGSPIREARIVAVEQDPPYDVGVFTLDEDLVFAGDEEVGDLVNRVAVCMNNGTWAGRYATEEPLQLPHWWYAQAEEDAGLGVVIRGEQ